VPVNGRCLGSVRVGNRNWIYSHSGSVNLEFATVCNVATSAVVRGVGSEEHFEHYLESFLGLECFVGVGKCQCGSDRA